MTSVRAGLLTCVLFAFASSAAPQECPVALGTGCDQIWLLANAKKNDPPTNFRLFYFISPVPAPIAWAGESGSAQPSAQGYAEIRDLVLHSPSAVKVVKVFDLRQESHAYIDGMPVTWYFGRDQINCGRSEQAMSLDERGRIALLPKSPKVQVYKSATTPSDIACKVGTDPGLVDVKNVQTEAEVVTALSKNGVQWIYYRLHVADFHAPSDELVDTFVEAARPTLRDTWLHFHCAAGDGRTTTFMAMAQMMIEARDKSLEDILIQQRDLGPDKTNLCCYCGSQQWRTEWARQRYWFLELFHLYCKEQPEFKVPFSVWKAQNHGRVPQPSCASQPSCAQGCKTKSTAACEDC